MNEILKILENRNLYTHLILFKIYLSTRGRTDTFFQGDMRKDFKELFGEEFSREDYQLAEHYLESEGLTQNFSKRLTNYGRDYFERWVTDFVNLNSEETQILETELPPKVFDFFGFTDKATKILDFVVKLKEVFPDA